MTQASAAVCQTVVSKAVVCKKNIYAENMLFLVGFLEDSSDHDGCQVTLNGAACYVPCHEAFSVNCDNKLASK